MSDAKHFFRAATAEQKEEYGKLRGHIAKRDYRDTWGRERRDWKARQTVTEADTKTDVKEAWYINFSMLVKAHGGQIDLTAATATAMTIARKCLQKGPPYV